MDFQFKLDKALEVLLGIKCFLFQSKSKLVQI